MYTMAERKKTLLERVKNYSSLDSMGGEEAIQDQRLRTISGVSQEKEDRFL